MRPGLEGPGGFVKLLNGGPQARLETALFGRGELLGEGEADEIGERVLDLGEAVLGGSGQRGEGVRSIAKERGPGVGEELLLIGRIGNRVGVDQCHRLSGAQRVTLEGAEQGVLLGGRESAKPFGECGTDAARPEQSLPARAETAADEEPALDPRAAFAETAGDLGNREPIVVDERADDTSLVERGEGTRRPIGGKEQALVFGRVAGSFEHHGELSCSALSRESQSFEAVDDLEAAVVERHGADRERDRIGGRRWMCRAGTEPSVAGTELLDRHHGERAREGFCQRHREPPGRARSEGRVSELAVADRFEARLAVVGVVLDLDHEPGAEEIGGFNGLTRSGGERTGLVEADDATASGGGPARAHAFEGEVIADVVVGRGNVIESVDDEQHAVAAATRAKASTGDGARVESRRRESVVEIRAVEAGFVHENLLLRPREFFIGDLRSRGPMRTMRG